MIVDDAGRKTGLAPLIGRDARLVILGSLPGDASLRAARYYGHPRNQFWRLLGAAIGEPLAERGYAERLALLAGRRIGLWDVIATASRQGSLDQSIRDAIPNPLLATLAPLADLRAVAFNGAAASLAGRRLLKEGPWRLIDLPSSSPANSAPFAQKLDRWGLLAAFVD